MRSMILWREHGGGALDSHGTAEACGSLCASGFGALFSGSRLRNEPNLSLPTLLPSPMRYICAPSSRRRAARGEPAISVGATHAGGHPHPLSQENVSARLHRPRRAFLDTMHAVSASSSVAARSASFGGSRASLRSSRAAARRGAALARTYAAVKEPGPAIVSKIHKVEVGSLWATLTAIMEFCKLSLVSPCATQESKAHSLTPERLEVIRDLDHFAANEVRLRSCPAHRSHTSTQLTPHPPRGAAHQPSQARGQVLAAAGPPSEPGEQGFPRRGARTPSPHGLHAAPR